MFNAICKSLCVAALCVAATGSLAVASDARHVPCYAAGNSEPGEAGFIVLARNEVGQKGPLPSVSPVPSNPSQQYPRPRPMPEPLPFPPF
jgi:hypothetical protein